MIMTCLSLISMNVQAQTNDSPYALFGDSTRTLDCQPLEMSSYDIPVVLDDGSSAMLTLDIPNHLAELKDEEGRVLATDTLPKHLQAIFLSVDPKASDYPHVSPYAYCMGNPVNITDPWGLDNVFLNSQGMVVRVIPNGSNTITIIHPNGVSHVLSDYDISSTWGLGLNNGQNRQIVANVAGFYGRQVGVTGIVATDRYMNSLASYNKGSGKILIGPYENGRVNNQLDDKYNLMNVLIHENFHKQDYPANNHKFLNHAKIVLKSMLHSTFGQASPAYREGQVGQFSQLVMNEYFSEKGHKTGALMLIKQFNSSNFGYQLDFDIRRKTIYVNGGERYVDFIQGDPSSGNLE